MGDEKAHLRLAKEKRSGALDEYKEGRFTNVGDLALKAVEQAIEAVASRQNLHFHAKPRSAHAERTRWAKANFPQIAADLDILWGAYHDLGYDGLDGKRAKKAVEAMKRILNEFEKRVGIRFK